jgi:hypothetical protein
MSDEVKASDQAALGVMFDDIAEKLFSQIERDTETEPTSAERAQDFDRFDPSDPRAQQERRRARLQCVIGIRIRRPAAPPACACADAVWFRPPADPLGAACPRRRWTSGAAPFSFLEAFMSSAIWIRSLSLVPSAISASARIRRALFLTS